jgi:peroxiredoxin
MKKILLSFAIFSVFVFMIPPTLMAADQPPKVGDPLPDLSLTIPKDNADKTYLGISGSGSFKIAQLKAQVVILEIFSMYCPFCQKEAPIVNKLYETIEAKSNLHGKIKIIGIAAGNSDYEADVFRKKYSVPFPLIPDADYEVYNKIGGAVRTPYFIVVRLNSDGTNRIVYTKLGALGDIGVFLQEIIESAGLR